MSKLLDLISKEPVMAAIGGVIAATIGALIAFGVHITDIQREAVEGWALALLALGVAVRSQVTPVAKLPKPAILSPAVFTGGSSATVTPLPEYGPTNVTPLPTAKPDAPEDVS